MSRISNRRRGRSGLKSGATILAAAVLSGGVPAAHAANNFTNALQTGTANSGNVVQGPGDNNQLGTALLAATQNGDNNVLEITQSGDDNEIGTLGTGLLQSADRNTLAITQTSDENTVRQITQTGLDGGAGTLALRRNTLTVTQQGGDANIISGIAQTRSAGSQSAAANSATITQTGEANRIGAATTATDAFIQNGFANTAVLSQTGSRNVVTGASQLGPGNTLNVSFTGNDNGTLGFAFPRAVTTTWGLLQGGISQNSQSVGAGAADGNALSFTLTGDFNGFGFAQEGLRNSLTGSVDGFGGGDRNQTAAVQLGDDNIATFAVFGSDNLLDLIQRSDGLGNRAEIDIAGDFNEVTLDQGGDSIADIDITGSSNILHATQSNGPNTLTIEIWGDHNNAAGVFSGIALAKSTLTSPALTPGDVVQNGAGNAISYSVGTSASLSHQNLFAFYQNGNDNSIIGSTVGSNNQVVIVQNGFGNLTSFTQLGNGNFIAVSQ